ncbi:MAG TPA: SDR family oxidoreductase [Solirubrobacteraceae bacterium]|nr:SDR family oxidoreductase [Solirubrobacteraceae bacterium]
MSSALIIGARNFGFAIAERLLTDGWEVTAGARSPDTLARVREAGAQAVETDVLDPESVRAALTAAAAASGRVDLVVNAASPYGGRREGPFGGGPLSQAEPEAFDSWAALPARGAFSFLSASARFLREQGGDATIVQVTGGSARRAMPGRGLWAAGAFAVRALTQSAALELREHGIHVALLIVDARIDRSDSQDRDSADPASLAAAVAYLASQSPRAMTHELQVTPALDNWTP